MNASVRNQLREAGKTDKNVEKRKKNLFSAFSQLKVGSGDGQHGDGQHGDGQHGSRSRQLME